MTTAEVHAQPPYAPLPRWWTAVVLCLAATSMGASLAYMWVHERPPSAAYALVNSAPSVASAMPALGCDNCGRVEAVLALAGAARGGTTPVHGEGATASVRRKTVYQVKVRMDDGNLRVLRLTQPLSVGTLVSLQRGVLRVLSASLGS